MYGRKRIETFKTRPNGMNSRGRVWAMNFSTIYDLRSNPYLRFLSRIRAYTWMCAALS
jgi:hypothetical protein